MAKNLFDLRNRLTAADDATYGITRDCHPFLTRILVWRRLRLLLGVLGARRRDWKIVSLGKPTLPTHADKRFRSRPRTDHVGVQLADVVVDVDLEWDPQTNGPNDGQWTLTFRCDGFMETFIIKGDRDYESGLPELDNSWVAEQCDALHAKFQSFLAQLACVAY